MLERRYLRFIRAAATAFVPAAIAVSSLAAELPPGAHQPPPGLRGTLAELERQPVDARQLSDAESAALGMRIPGGVVIVSVPAGAHGLKAGDVLSYVGGDRVKSVTELNAVLERISAPVEVIMHRDGQPERLSIRFPRRVREVGPSPPGPLPPAMPPVSTRPGSVTPPPTQPVPGATRTTRTENGETVVVLSGVEANQMELILEALAAAEEAGRGDVPPGVDPELYAALREAFQSGAVRVEIDDEPSLGSPPVKSTGTSGSAGSYEPWETGAPSVAGPEVARLIKRLAHSEAAERMQAAMELGEFGQAAVPAIPALTRALSDSEATVRMAAARGIAGVGAESKAASATDALIVALSDRSPVVRAEAANAIGQIGLMGPPANRAAAALRLLRNDRDPRVRKSVAEALDWMGYD